LPVWLSFAAVFGLLVAAAVGFVIYRSAATTTVVVLARHAEKDLSSIQDPPLSPEGEQRAERLAQMFGRGSGVGHIDLRERWPADATDSGPPRRAPG